MSQSYFSGNPSGFLFSFSSGFGSRRRFSLPRSFIAVSSLLHANRALIVRSAAQKFRSSEDHLLQDQNDNKLMESIEKNIPPSAQDYSSFSNLPIWLNWILGVLPYYKKLSAIEDKLEKAAEELLEEVEKVADQVDKLCEEVTEKLPEGDLKQLILKVEEVAEVVDHTAHVAESLVKKVEEVVEEVDEAVKNARKESHGMFPIQLEPADMKPKK